MFYTDCAAETNFPPHEAFFSNLTGKSVDLQLYETARTHFYKCKALDDRNKV